MYCIIFSLVSSIPWVWIFRIKHNGNRLMGIHFTSLGTSLEFVIWLYDSSTRIIILLKTKTHLNRRLVSNCKHYLGLLESMCLAWSHRTSLLTLTSISINKNKRVRFIIQYLGLFLTLRDIFQNLAKSIVRYKF